MHDVKTWVNPKGRQFRKRPLWRTVHIIGPVWCDRCGRSLHNEACWERDEAHVIAGKFRCPECHPRPQDYQ